MQRILIVTDAWHPQVNGVVRTIASLVGELSDRGFDVKVVRDGKEITVKVTLGRLEDGEQLAQAQADDADQMDETPTRAALGMTFAELSDEARTEYTISEDVEGVLISEVEEGSTAADKGIAAGNVIVEIAQSAVDTPDDVIARLEELKDDGRRNALLMVANPDGELRFVTIRMD